MFILDIEFKDVSDISLFIMELLDTKYGNGVVINNLYQVKNDKHHFIYYEDEFNQNMINELIFIEELLNKLNIDFSINAMKPIENKEPMGYYFYHLLNKDSKYIIPETTNLKLLDSKPCHF